MDTKTPKADTNIAVTDSGSTDDISGIKELFEYIVPLAKDKFAIMGDDVTKLKIHGYGMINYYVNNKRV